MSRRELSDEEDVLTFRVDGRPSGALRLEVSGSRRLRLRADDRTLLWARVWSGWYGVTLVRPASETSPGILPSFRASEARAHTDR